jgi:uroporphyrinogen decarboxylase
MRRRELTHHERVRLALDHRETDRIPISMICSGINQPAYGELSSFEGEVRVQKTLPLGTSDDVREEVRELIRLLGNSGGYILGPAHVIQAGTPAENILAMFDTAMEIQL